MPETFFQVIMRLDGDLYSPELNDDQFCDHDTIIKDVADGQFLGEFVSLIQFERGTRGKVHAWDITNEVTDQEEAA